VLVTPPFVAVRVTVCVPSVVKLVEGFVNTEVPVVPNVHKNVLPAMGVVVLVKFTTSGAQPEVGLAVNPAVSCACSCGDKHTETNNKNRALNIFM
jgi:predicted transcriptional regulator